MPLPKLAQPTQTTGLLGHPVAHSLSPALHQAWRAKHQINGEYLAFDVPPDEVPAAIESMRNQHLQGLNITVPHKQAVLAHVDVLDAPAKQIGAANTLYWHGDALHATNTDAYGFIENLRAQMAGAFDAALHNVLVLGAGGAARAVCFALQQAGAGQVVVANRTRATAEALAESFGAKACAWDAQTLSNVSLLINTTSLGMEGQPPQHMSLDDLPSSAWVHDIVYKPLHTELLKRAQARGNCVATGLGMLAYQAQAAFEIWHGVRPEVTPEMLHALEARAC